MSLQITKFISDYFKRKEGFKIYKNKLNTFPIDQKLSNEAKQNLTQIISDYGIRENQLLETKKKFIISVFNKLAEDKRLPDDDIAVLDDVIDYFAVDINTTGINTNLLRKYHNLSLIDEERLPDVTEASKNELDILLKPDEIVHFRTNSQLRKFRKVTKTIQYKGFTGSVRIMKGISYRVGSLDLNRVSQNILAVDDFGFFYITNKRIGYHGQRKQFSILNEKISSFELQPEGLFIFKDSKETPYILTLDDYDVPLAMVSLLLNKEQ
jgi:hypothetical protein